MKVELRKFKHSPSLSQDTEAFSAELWIDGNKAADVSNNGSGGCHRIYFNDNKLRDAFAKYCEGLPAVKSEYGDLKMDDDFFISQLVEGQILRKQLASWCKKNTVYRRTDTPKGSWIKCKMTFTPEIAAKLRKVEGTKLVLIVNEDIDKAVDFAVAQ